MRGIKRRQWQFSSTKHTGLKWMDFYQHFTLPEILAAGEKPSLWLLRPCFLAHWRSCWLFELNRLLRTEGRKRHKHSSGICKMQEEMGKQDEHPQLQWLWGRSALRRHFLESGDATGCHQVVQGSSVPWLWFETGGIDMEECQRGKRTSQPAKGFWGSL